MDTEVSLDSGVTYKLWVNAHNKTDYNSICSNESEGHLENTQLHPGDGFMFDNTFEKIFFVIQCRNKVRGFVIYNPR